jgi:branched-chain amino acid transport system substrate-binding protein
LCACSDPRPIRLGFLGGLSGRVADLGIGGRDGALLAVEQRNAQGGIRGRPVRLLVRDDRQDPETARAAAQDLIDRGAVAVIGPMTSAVAMATVPLANRHQVVMVSPTVTTTDLSGRDDFFLRVSATTRDYARKTARYLAERESVRSATLVFDLHNEAYTRSGMDNFKQEFLGRGGRVAGEVPFTSGEDTVMVELARRAAAPGADAVVISAGAMDAAMLCQQFAKLRARPPGTWRCRSGPPRSASWGWGGRPWRGCWWTSCSTATAPPPPTWRSTRRSASVSRSNRVSPPSTPTTRPTWSWRPWTATRAETP